MRSHNPYPQKFTFYWLFLTNSTWSVTIPMTSTPTQCQSYRSLNPTTNPSPTATLTQGIGPRPLLFWTPLLFRVVWALGIPLHCVYCQFRLLPILLDFEQSMRLLAVCIQRGSKKSRAIEDKAVLCKNNSTCFGCLWVALGAFGWM